MTHFLVEQHPHVAKVNVSIRDGGLEWHLKHSVLWFERVAQAGLWIVGSDRLQSTSELPLGDVRSEGSGLFLPDEVLQLQLDSHGASVERSRFAQTGIPPQAPDLRCNGIC